MVDLAQIRTPAFQRSAGGDGTSTPCGKVSNPDDIRVRPRVVGVVDG